MREEKDFNGIKKNYKTLTFQWRYEKRIERFQERIQSRSEQNEIRLHLYEQNRLNDYTIKQVQK